MKLVLPGVNFVFDCATSEYVNCMVVENQSLLYEILCDLNNQVNGGEGKAILSEDNKVLPIDKYMDVQSSFFPFDINQKSLVNKLTAYLNRISVDESHYVKSMEMVGAVERFMMDLASDTTGNVEFNKISLENIIKSSGVGFADDYESLAEKLLDYMELVEEYERHKLFIFVNLRCFISDDDMNLFIDTALLKNYEILLIEGSEHRTLKTEKRYIVDENLCEIC